MTGQSRKLADCTDGLSQLRADVDVCIDNGVDVDVDVDVDIDVDVDVGVGVDMRI